HQPDSVIPVDPGANVTLQCFFAENYIKAGAVVDPIFHKGYLNKRFSISRSKKIIYLSIINIRVEICFDIEFGNEIPDSKLTLSIYELLTQSSNVLCRHKCPLKNIYCAYISEERLCPAVLGLACTLGLCCSGQDNQVRGQSSAQVR
uniref:Uncharacterized protein n=1 Tax=Cyprinus carpio carpio TaxID=630221 RepID=A0A8C1I172_CYPCA